MNPIFGKEARKKRRQEGTSVRNASWEELKSNLEQFKPDQEDSYFSAGEFRPIKREVVMFTDSPDVLEHEMTHAAQFGPLQRAALRAGMKDPGRAQDPEKRKAQKKILKSLTDEQWESMGKRGRYTLGSGKEYEAITTAGVNSLKRRFGEVGRDFESIKKQLYSIPESETNPNIRLLRDAVGGLSTEKQKDLFMKSIFSNLQS
jgi:hypothetical protein